MSQMAYFKDMIEKNYRIDDAIRNLSKLANELTVKNKLHYTRRSLHKRRITSRWKYWYSNKATG